MDDREKQALVDAFFTKVASMDPDEVIRLLDCFALIRAEGKDFTLRVNSPRGKDPAVTPPGMTDARSIGAGVGYVCYDDSSPGTPLWLAGSGKTRSRE